MKIIIDYMYSGFLEKYVKTEKKVDHIIEILEKLGKIHSDISATIISESLKKEYLDYNYQKYKEILAIICSL